MTFSLNEIESTAKKATRGAGYPWGLAEEAAKATRWLSAQGQAGCAILLEALRRFDGVPLAPHRPDVAQTEWRAAEGVMCPLAAGSALADRAKVLNSKDIHLENLCAPALILPFAASTAAVLGQPVSVRWEGGAATVSATQLSLEGALPRGETTLTVALGSGAGPGSGQAVPTVSRAAPEAEIWVALCAFAHRTYAPATEESRLKGAGAETPSGD